jgi:hypothetical protein
MHSKTIAHSVKDQQYTLSVDELESRQFKWLSKLIVVTSSALQALTAENFNICCSAITGLNKLVPKVESPSPMALSPTLVLEREINSAQNNYLASPKVSSFTIASNAMSESAEEQIMRNIKIEINANDWRTLKSLSEVAISDLGQQGKKGMNYYRSKKEKEHNGVNANNKVVDIEKNGLELNIDGLKSPIADPTIEKQNYLKFQQLQEINEKNFYKQESFISGLVRQGSMKSISALSREVSSSNISLASGGDKFEDGI